MSSDTVLLYEPIHLMMKYILNWKATFSPLLSVYGGEIINVWDKIEDNQLWDLHKNGDGAVRYCYNRTDHMRNLPGKKHNLQQQTFFVITLQDKKLKNFWPLEKLLSFWKNFPFCLMCEGSKGIAKMAPSIISNDTLLCDKRAQFWKFLPFPPIKIMWPFLLIF